MFYNEDDKMITLPFALTFQVITYTFKWNVSENGKGKKQLLTNVPDVVLKSTVKSFMNYLGLECISFAKSIMVFLSATTENQKPFGIP